MNDAELVRRLINLGHNFSLSGEDSAANVCHKAAARIIDLTESCQPMWHPSLQEPTHDK